VSGGNYVGGLVGWNEGTVSNSFAMGSVTGSGDSIGGLIGRLWSGSVTNTYSTGLVGGSGGNKGGLIGYIETSNNPTVTSSYWDLEASGMSASAGGEGRTTEEMKKRVTYIGWDFENTWGIDEGVNYPYLQWEIRDRAYEVPQEVELGEWVSESGLSNRYYDYVVQVGSGIISLIVEVEVLVGNVNAFHLLGSYGRNTSLNMADWRGISKGSNGIVLAVSPVLPGLYYFSVVVGSLDESAVFYRIRVIQENRYISGVSPKELSNQGKNWVIVNGVGLSMEDRLELLSCDGAVLVSALPLSVSVDGRVAEYVLDLGGVIPQQGQYRISWGDGGSELIGECDVEIYEPKVGPRFEVSFRLPSTVRNGRVYTGYFVYRNTGDMPMDSPLCLIQNTASWLMRLKGANEWVSDSLVVLCSNSEPPWTVLMPGSVNYIPFEFKVTSFDLCKFSVVLCDMNGDTVPWEEYNAMLKPPEVTEEEWQNMWVDVVNYLGVSWWDLYQGILEEANRVGDRGGNVYDVGSLLWLRVNQGLGNPIAQISGRVFIRDEEGNISILPDVLVKLYNDLGSDLEYVDSVTTDNGGNFMFDGIGDGTYRLEVEGYQVLGGGAIKVISQADVLNRDILVGPLPEPEPVGEIRNYIDDFVLGEGAGRGYMFVSYGDRAYLYKWLGDSWERNQELPEGVMHTDLMRRIEEVPGESGKEGLFLMWSGRDELTGEDVMKWRIGIRDIGNSGDWQWSEEVVFRSGKYRFGIPIVGEIRGGRYAVIWLVKGSEGIDDYDVYYSELEVSSKGITLLPVVESHSDEIRQPKQDCTIINIGRMLTSLNEPIPIMGGEYGLSFSGSVCSNPPDCSTMSRSGEGSIGATIKVSDLLTATVGGGVTLQESIVCKPAPHLVFNQMEANLTGGAQFSLLTLKKPVVFLVGFVPVQLTFKLGGSVSLNQTGKLIWTQKGSILPQRGETLYTVVPEIVGRVDAYDLGGMLDYGLAGAEIKLSGSIGLKYISPLQISFAGYCITLTGKIDVVFGFWGRSISGKWGTGCKYVPSIDGFYEEWGRDYHQISYGRSGGAKGGKEESEEIVIEETKEPITGTGNVYSEVGIPVLGSLVGQDLYNDNSPAVAEIGDTGRLVLVWTKDSGDYENELGSRVVSSEYDGTQWTLPVEIQGVGFNSNPSVAVMDSSGTVLSVWSYASSAGLTIDSELQQIKLQMEQSDIYYAVRDSQGQWLQAQPVVELAGSDMVPVVVSSGNGDAIACWLHYEEGMDLANKQILVSKYSGGIWGEPRVITEAGGITKLRAVWIDGKYVLVWLQVQLLEGGSQVSHLYYATSVNGDEWVGTNLLEDEQTGGKVGVLPHNATLLSQWVKMEEKSESIEECCEGEGEGEGEGQSEGQNEGEWPPEPPGGEGETSSGGVQPVRPRDPNEKVGPIGVGENQGVYKDETLVYTIYFENVPTATAPAQEVVVIDDLSAYLDIYSLRVMDIRWGDYSVEIPKGEMFSNAQVTIKDYRPEVNKEWVVDVSLEMNIKTGRLIWRFRTIDPETGDLPEDALAGFLPPNDDTGRGEGHITFTVHIRPETAIGTKISNKAMITFDNEQSITTNEVVNEVIAPVSAEGEEGMTEGEGAVEGEGIVEGLTEGIIEGVIEGVLEGMPEGVEEEGMTGGEGAVEGEGIVEGSTEGEGIVEGATEGEGTAEGSVEGTSEGTLEGEGVTEGEGEGGGTDKGCGCFGGKSLGENEQWKYLMDFVLFSFLILLMSGMDKKRK